MQQLLSTFQLTLSPYSSPAKITPPCLVKGLPAFEYRFLNHAFGWSKAHLEGLDEKTSLPSMRSWRNQFKFAEFPYTDCSNFQGFMLVVMVSPAEKWRPIEAGGSNEASMPFSWPISVGWFSEDLPADMLITLGCMVIGVISREILDGKCFSDAPAPRSFMIVSDRSLITSHLIKI
ncbi:hypothetical protein OROGR_022675 [Orobanche gracilis]